jgi:hypothetical protein
MRTISPTPPVSTPHTEAWLALEQNLDSISHMVYLGGREIGLLIAEGNRFSTYLRKPRDLTKKATATNLERVATRYVKSTQARVDRYKTANLWQVVMLVTCVEAYLQDLLSAAASVSPELMSESQQLAPYADVISANSLDELANTMRARWARGWMRDGGPTRWISRLVKMGARGYPADLAPRLELIWGIRHAVVHAAGVANANFVKRHPGVVKAAGDHLRVSIRDFGVFLGTARGFLEPTERYFLARHPSLRAKVSAGRAK